MALEIRLLGPPQVLVDGEPRPAPKGRKAWGLLTYLLLSERPPSRSWLAGLLFSDADDPLGALRWSLAELRRVLGADLSVGGDPLVLEVPAQAAIDVRRVTGHSDAEQEDIDLGLELLAGMDFASAPGFEAWLNAERRELASISAAQTRRVAMSRLAGGANEAAAAARLAARLVEVDPLDEGAQALLIRSLAAAGDRAGAARQFTAARAILQRELGVDPGPELEAARSLAVARPAAQAGSQPGRPAVARVQLQSGQAAIAAGALDQGIACLREAAAAAEEAGDRQLQGTALAELGSALVHAVRGRDGEGASALHRALSIAEDIGDEGLAARASGELGWVELLAGRYATAGSWFTRASTLLAEDPGARSWAEANSGIALCDTGRHQAGLAMLDTAAGWALEAGHQKNLCWSLAFIGRSRLLRGELDLARLALEESHRLAVEIWPYFISWPASLLGDLALADARPEHAVSLYEDAFAHACHLADPCWEGMSLRGLGLHTAAAGRVDHGLEQLREACSRVVRFDDTYHWAVAYCRDGLAQVGVRAGAADALRWAKDLESLASRLGMREIGVRAQLYLSELGQPGALTAAEALAAEVENPALDSLIASHASSHA